MLTRSPAQFHAHGSSVTPRPCSEWCHLTSCQGVASPPSTEGVGHLMAKLGWWEGAEAGQPSASASILSRAVFRMDISQLPDRYFDSWNSHHSLSLLRVFGPTGILRGPFAYDGVSGAALSEYASRLWRAFPDFFLQTQAPLLGPQKMSVEWVLHGTHQAELFGFPASGRQVVLNGVEIIDFSGAERLVVRSSYDALDLVRQLTPIDLPLDPELLRTLPVGRSSH